MELQKTILAQLGGNMFAMMTGAKSFVAIDNGLVFAIPGTSTRNKANRVGISLMANDTYTVSFSRVYGTKIKLISAYTDVYCDMLRDLFTTETGLLTSFRG